MLMREYYDLILSSIIDKYADDVVLFEYFLKSALTITHLKCDSEPRLE